MRSFSFVLESQQVSTSAQRRQERQVGSQHKTVRGTCLHQLTEGAKDGRVASEQIRHFLLPAQSSDSQLPVPCSSKTALLQQGRWACGTSVTLPRKGTNSGTHASLIAQLAVRPVQHHSTMPGHDQRTRSRGSLVTQACFTQGIACSLVHSQQQEFLQDTST